VTDGCGFDFKNNSLRSRRVTLRLGSEDGAGHEADAGESHDDAM
jgi:hypothetical protein